MNRIVFLLIILSFPSTIIASDLSRAEKRYTKELEAAQRLMEREEWNSAMKRLSRLLDNDESHDFAANNFARISKMVKECVFKMEVPSPDLNALFSGDVLSYNPGTGKIKMKYKTGNMGDFEKKTLGYGSNRATVHSCPAIFTGPHSISIKGKAYPGATQRCRPLIQVCRQGSSYYTVDFGFMSETVKTSRSKVRGRCVTINWAEPRITMSEGSVSRVAARKAASPVRSNKPFALKVRVEKSTIDASYNGKRLLHTRTGKKLSGQLSFTSFPFDEMIIEGKVDPEWIAQRMQVAEKEALSRFDKTYDPGQHLPARLVE